MLPGSGSKSEPIRHHRRQEPAKRPGRDQDGTSPGCQQVGVQTVEGMPQTLLHVRGLGQEPVERRGRARQLEERAEHYQGQRQRQHGLEQREPGFTLDRAVRVASQRPGTPSNASQPVAEAP